MATKYLRNVTTTKWKVDASWALNADGTGDTSYPTNLDDVICDASAGITSLSIGTSINDGPSPCKSLDTTNFSGALTGNYQLQVLEDLIIGPNVSTIGTFVIYFVTAGRLKTNGKSIPYKVISYGGSLTLLDSLNTSNTVEVRSNKSLTTNNNNISCGTFSNETFSGVTLTLGASQITCTTLNLSGANLTLTANTAQFICSGNFTGGANLNLNGASVKFVEVSTKTISGNNTMNKLESDTTAGANTIQLTAGTTQTVQKLVINSEPSKLCNLQSTSSTPATINSINDQFVKNCIISNVNVGGGGNWYYDPNSCVVVNSTGWTPKNFSSFNSLKNTFNETKNRFGGHITSKTMSVVTPLSISGLQLWLDASRMNLANNASVASWTDLSGNSNHAVQSTEDNKPLFKTGVQNGLPGILFDGNNDYLRIAHNDNLNCYPITIFLVAKTNSDIQWSSLFCKFKNISADNLQGYDIENNLGKYSFYYFKDKNNKTSVDTNLPINDNIARIIKCKVNNNGSFVSVNNELPNSTAWTGTPNPPIATYDMLLAATWNYIGAIVLFNSCTIFEFCIWNKELSTAEDTAMNLYLSQKWGIAIA